jgi:glycosyltransferase involved in cell wall biosynthesis
MMDQKNTIEISVVIPVFNAAGTLKELYRRLTVVLENLKKVYEIIFVDDGSTDESFQILKGLNTQDKRVKVVRFTRNFGQHPALAAGFRQCRGKVIVQMDADLQNPPEEIPKLLDKHREGYEVVFGIRKKRKDPFYRKISSSLVSWIMRKFIDGASQPNPSAFKVMGYQVVDALNQCQEKSRFTSGLISWLGFSQTGIEVEHVERADGKSSYNFLKLFFLSLDLLTGFSSLPLQIASVMGFIFSLLGLISGSYILLKKLFIGYYVLGYASVIVAILFFSGVQLLCLGVIGEYLTRVYREAQGRPLYVIKETVE